MGFQNGMGVWGKGQLEHVSDGELLNSTLWITFWRDYKMIFSIGSLAHSRAPSRAPFWGLKSLMQTRKDWADHANQALARAGIQERITGASLEQQYRDALEAGDEREAARLKYRGAWCAHRAA